MGYDDALKGGGNVGDEVYDGADAEHAENASEATHDELTEAGVPATRRPQECRLPSAPGQLLCRNSWPRANRKLRSSRRMRS